MAFWRLASLRFFLKKNTEESKNKYLFWLNLTIDNYCVSFKDRYNQQHSQHNIHVEKLSAYLVADILAT